MFALRNQNGLGETVLICFQIRVEEVKLSHNLIPV